MGKVADKTYVQKRILNSSRGPAVWALRAQTDKWEYSNAMREEVESNEKVFIREGMVTELLVNSNDECVGVETHFGMQFHSKAVVLTTGTFMNGKIWVGRKTIYRLDESGRRQFGWIDRKHLINLGLKPID